MVDASDRATAERNPILLCLLLSVLAHTGLWLGGGAPKLSFGGRFSRFFEAQPASVPTRALVTLLPPAISSPEGPALPRAPGPVGSHRPDRPGSTILPPPRPVRQQQPSPPPPMSPQLPQSEAYPKGVDRPLPAALERPVAAKPSPTPAPARPSLTPPVTPGPRRTVSPSPQPLRPSPTPEPAATPLESPTPSPKVGGVWGDSTADAPGRPPGGAPGQRNAMALGPQPVVRRSQSKATATSVKLELTIHPDGRVSVVLLNSTGDSAYDARIQAAYELWRWRAAIMNGRPVTSTETATYQVPPDR